MGRMAKIVYTWELGGGLGHILPFRTVAEQLLHKGHSLVCVTRDPIVTTKGLAGLEVQILPVPKRTGRPQKTFEPIRTFAHLLHNAVACSAESLRELTAGWQAFFHQIQPDLMICDHSPAALIALRGNSARCVTFGTGFFRPLDQQPLPMLRGNPKTDAAALALDEERVLRTINMGLRHNRQPLLGHLAQLYADTDAGFLTTFTELDHYGARDNECYWGVWNSGVGQPIAWPSGCGPKVFAYLKKVPYIASLIGRLRELGLPTIVFSPDIPAAAQTQLAGDNVTFADQPVCLEQMSAECDLVITHATHATLARLLLAGRPQLLLPIMLEQAILAKRCEQEGFGVADYSGKPEQIVRKLDELLSSDRYALAARRFAAKYADFNPEQSVAELVARLESLANGPRRVW